MGRKELVGKIKAEGRLTKRELKVIDCLSH